MADRLGDWIQTFSGVQMHPLDPRPEDVRIDDIAHALSNLCRFTGHTRTFYSVAQHSVLVSRNVPPPAALLGLLHDAAEAYLSDIARPWKRYLWVGLKPGSDQPWPAGFERLKEREESLLRVILTALGVYHEPATALWPEVERADVLLLATEARDLMAPLHPDWHHCAANGFDVLPDPIVPWTPGRAKWEFLARYQALKGAA
jgi:hypothetical protein